MGIMVESLLWGNSGFLPSTVMLSSGPRKTYPLLRNYGIENRIRNPKTVGLFRLQVGRICRLSGFTAVKGSGGLGI